VFMSIRKLSELIRTRQVSPLALAEIFIDRLEKLGPKYNAVVTVTSKIALDQARLAEQEIASGNYRGPLHGIPYGAKDLLATSKGIPTTWGAAPFRDQIFDYDATVIDKLERAGSALAAKLAMVELAGGMGFHYPDASFTGPGINPWDLTKWSGGSSNGSASAVCAGLVPYAMGSETWGSILYPASNCGISGLRPTYGRVSRYGAMALSWSLDKLGPLCLTADDCGLVLDAIAGADPKDPTTTTRPFKYTSACLERPFKLGVLRGVTDEADESVRANFEQALKVLERVATIETVEFPDLPFEEIFRTIFFAETYSAFEDFIESDKIKGLTAPEDRYVPYARMTIMAKDYIRALRLRGIVARKIANVMNPFDALLAPTRPIPATLLAEPIPSLVRGVMKDLMSTVGNLAGLPAISVCNGFSEKGVPTGLQFMGSAYRENMIIAVARAYQSLTDWHLCHPIDASQEA